MARILLQTDVLCKNCNGSGKVIIPYTHLPACEVTCPLCMGTGKEWEWVEPDKVINQLIDDNKIIIRQKNIS